MAAAVEVVVVVVVMAMATGAGVCGSGAKRGATGRKRRRCWAEGLEYVEAGYVRHGAAVDGQVGKGAKGGFSILFAATNRRAWSDVRAATNRSCAPDVSAFSVEAVEESLDRNLLACPIVMDGPCSSQS